MLSSFHIVNRDFFFVHNLKKKMNNNFILTAIRNCLEIFCFIKKKKPNLLKCSRNYFLWIHFPVSAKVKSVNSYIHNIYISPFCLCVVKFKRINLTSMNVFFFFSKLYKYRALAADKRINVEFHLWTTGIRDNCMTETYLWNS